MYRLTLTICFCLLLGSQAIGGWAIKRDNGTYRSWFENGQDGLLQAGESWEKLATKPTITVAGPDVKGFRAWLEANMTFALRNSVAKAYPNFMADLNAQEWADFQAGCIAANAAVPLTAGQWTAFKNAIATYKIPVTLP